MNKRMNQHGHIKCCKWVPWQHLDGSWFALYFHRQRNIKFSFRRHILYNKINLLVVPKSRPLRTKFQKSSCQRHENSIVGMDPMATHCRKLIVTGIYQANSYQKFVMSYWLAFVPKALNMLSILKCNNYVLAIGLFRAFPSNKMFPLDGIIPSNLEIRGKIFSQIKWDIGYFDLIYVLICFVTLLNKHSTASEMPESEKVKNVEKIKVKKAGGNR